jgi:hypothetical protein
VNDEDRPVAYTALHQGMPVVSGSGRKFGVLDRVLDDQGEILHGIAVRTASGVRFVARDCIEQMTTTQIRCSLTDQEVKDLPPAPSARRTGARRWFSRS